MWGMRIVGYIRVSTDRQAERGFGLDVQEQQVRRWARANGHRLVAIYRDEAKSGTKDALERDGLADALHAVRMAKRANRPAGTVWAEGIVVPRLDRLARDLVMQEQLLAELWRMGGQVFSTSPSETTFLSDDPEDPSRALIRQILGAVAQYERSMIRLRLMGGRRRKAERGGYAGGGRPFGFRSVDGELVPDLEEAAALERMRRLRKDGRSLRQIAEVLEHEGHRPRKSSRWHPEVLRGILDRAG